VAAALERIRARHEFADDPWRGEMGTEPAEVLGYLRRRWAAGTGRATAVDDVWDELTLSAAVHWAEVERERALLRRARHLGLSLSELGAHFGIRTRQGMRDHLDRLDALVETGTPDEQHTRDTRREARARPADQRWLDTHHDDMTTTISQLVEQLDRIDLSPTAADNAETDGHEAEWVDELRLETQRGELTTGTMGVLSLALGELRVHPTVRDLDRGHGLHRALRAAERLRARYDEARAQHPL
jgi:hypothetical protein